MLQSLTAVTGTNVGTLATAGDVACNHLLRFENEAEIVRGRTEWRSKSGNNFRILDHISADHGI